jgi:hypothetical protein
MKENEQIFIERNLKRIFDANIQILRTQHDPDNVSFMLDSQDQFRLLLTFGDKDTLDQAIAKAIVSLALTYDLFEDPQRVLDQVGYSV